MWSLFFRWTKTGNKKNAGPRQLWFEQLETRDCPYGMPHSVLTLDAEVLAGHVAQLSGEVTGTVIAGLTVTFSGVVSGSTTTDSSGDFSFSTTSATLGTVSAVGSGLATTNTASATLAVDAPTMFLSILDVTPGNVFLFGNVSGLDSVGQTVTLSGIGSGSATTDDTGSFTFSASVSATGTISAVTTDLWGQSSNIADVSVDSLPTATTLGLTLDAEVLAGHQVTLTGNLSDDYAAGATVSFSGAVSGSTFTDSDGNYVFTTEAASLGTVYATATDQQMNSTGTVSADIAVDAPVLTLSIASVTENTVTLTGTVTGLNPAGQSIAISGMASDTVISDADGNFSITTPLLGTGTIQASTTDLWGQDSNTAEVSVDSLATTTTPQITLHSEVLTGHEVQLTGRVTGDYAAGATVTFAGAVAATTTADSDGYFSYTTDSASLGDVSATAVDTASQSSNTATTTIGESGPALTLAISSTTSSTTTISGHLTGTDVGSQTITISGAVAETVTTDSDGNFSMTVDTSTAGEIDATTTDVWGQDANFVAVDMPASPPQLVNFRAVHEFGTLWVFTGTVLGQGVTGINVTYGGLTTIADQTTTVLPTGQFGRGFFLQADEIGTAWAFATDEWGRESNTAGALVR